MVRAARRRSGLSQRELARRARVSPTTVVAVEAGKQTPSLRVVSALLAAAGLELCVDLPTEPVCRHVRRHLTRSLTVRLHLALGGNGRPASRPVLPAWQQLRLLSRAGRVQADGPLAVALWLPPVEPLLLPTVVLTREDRSGPVPKAPDLRVREVPSQAPGPVACSLGIALSPGVLMTPPPDELARAPQHAEVRRSLRSVAALLDERAARDRAGRRGPAHREPRRQQEEWRLLFARSWSPRLLPPDPADARGWRLGDEVGMDDWIERRARRG